MKKRVPVVLAILCCFLVSASFAWAQANPGDAQTWVKKGVEFFKANGKDKAIEAFSDPKGEFVKGDLYIYMLDLNGKMLAHPKSDLVGKDFTLVKDANGKTFAVDIVKIAKEKGSGWVDYKWEDPKTKVAEPKTVYFEKVDNVIICAGAYKL